MIPDRDAPDLLHEALASIGIALEAITEPVQIVVVANGAPRERYQAVLEQYPFVELIHSPGPLGFSAAIGRGLAAARYDWTLLLNNDMTLEPGALRELAARRAEDVFAIAAQIMQQSADRRREETGLVDWYIDATGIRVFHSVPGRTRRAPRQPMRQRRRWLVSHPTAAEYVRDSSVYDPFYWEDVEWGVRARQDGYRVLFCATAKARHRHRATTARFYAASEIDRIVERNRILFDMRNAVTGNDADSLLQQVCDQPYALAAGTRRVLDRPESPAPALALAAKHPNNDTARHDRPAARAVRTDAFLQFRSGDTPGPAPTAAGNAVLRLPGASWRRTAH